MLKRPKKKEAGQALIEFIMLIPLLMAFVWYLVHINLAINKSIVGQKHARSQLFLKMFNHRSGPVANDFNITNRSAFYIGVASEVVSGTATYKAPVEVLGIGSNPKDMQGANDEPGEAEANSLRQKVRIRTVFGICTHRKQLPDGSGPTDFCGSVPTGN